MNIGKVKSGGACEKGQFPESSSCRQRRVRNVQVCVRPGVPGGDEGHQHLHRLAVGRHAAQGEAQALQVPGENETETIVNTNELEEVGQSTMQWLFGKFLC